MFARSPFVCTLPSTRRRMHPCLRLQVWTVLYGAMGLAAHRVWKAGGGPLPLTLYATQLALNFVWR